MANALTEMKKTSDFLVCVDSDGCVFDTMEVKHKECFIPNTINYWNLQAVSKFAREAAEYVNLYSQHRGINRFPALIEVIDLLSERPEVLRRGFVPPQIDSLRRWAETEPKLGNPALISYCDSHPDDEVMQQTLRWSKAVNDTVAYFVHGVPPFPYVRECFEKLSGHADIVVVSATPCDALEREWAEHDVAKYTTVIAGQEMGNKKECIRQAMAAGYSPDRVIMLGDAPGDMKAADANGALFYPINPSCEEDSWKRFYEEGIDKFLSGTFGGEYQTSRVNEFQKYLPDCPPWKK